MDLRDNLSIKAKPAKAITSILLPFCVELERDVFLEIVRNAVWHSTMDNEYIVAVKSGMTAKTVCVKSNDLLVNWKELTSKSQQLRQHQLLGYWATENFPALGEKLFADKWKAIRRQSVKVVGSEDMPSDAVDTVIMRKMKLRSIELKVSPTTIPKLKLFVKTPKNTGTYNEIRISPAMKSFDIEGDHIDKCWKQLRYGNPPMGELQSDSNKPDQTGTAGTTEVVSYINGETDVDSDRNDLSGSSARAVKRLHTSKANEIISHNGLILIPLVKRIHLDFTTNTADAEANVQCNTSAGSEVIHATEQTQIDTNVAKEPTGDSFQTLLLEMRTEIQNLNKRLTSATQMKTTDEDLRKENEMLKQHIEANKTLISSLQLGVESSNKLHQMMEFSFQKQAEDSAKNLAEDEKMKSEWSKKNSTLKKELFELKNFITTSQKCSNQQIEDLKKRLVEAESVNVETSEKNAKLDHDLNHYFTSVETPLQQKIHNLTNKLSEAERLTIEEKTQMSEKNAKLAEELGEVKQHATNIQSLYEDRIHELNKNEREAVAMSEKVKKMEAQIIELQSSVATKDVEIIEARKAEENLKMLKEYTSSMAKDLQNQIAEVEKKMADTHKTNIELTLKNENLESELKRWKRDSPPIVRDEDSLAVVDQVEGAEDNIAVVEQVVSADNNDSAVPEQVFDLNKVVPNESQWTDPAPNFISDDPIVRKCRCNLAKLPFGWMKFNKLKNAKYYPAFVYPTDEDGKRRAQWVISDGYISDFKKEFYDYHRSLPNELKKSSEVRALKKFNNKFQFGLS